MLKVSFVRRRGGRDRVYVSRDDGSSVGWDFPSYGDGLPHDLCHLVVEGGLRLTEGFWGLVDQGVDVGLVNNEATLIRDGTPVVDQVGIGFAGLTEAEEAVALLAGPTVRVAMSGALAVARLASEGDATATIGDRAQALGFVLPASATPAAITAIVTRLSELTERWRCLPDGGAIELSFSRREM